MTREILPDGLEKEKKERGLRTKIKDLLGALSQNKEEKKKSIDKKNEELLQDFQESYGKHFEECGRYGGEITIRPGHSNDDIRYFSRGLKDYSYGREKTIKFENFRDMKVCLTDGTLSSPKDNWNLGLIDGASFLKIKILGAEGFNHEDIAYIFKHMNIGVQKLYLEFPYGIFSRNESSKIIKLFEKFIGSDYISGCYFELGDGISQDSLHGIVSWFTKKGKSGKIRDCIIKANGKEYHSSGDYRYEFSK